MIVLEEERKSYPDSNYDFAHPFLEIPDAQSVKNYFNTNKPNPEQNAII